MKITQIKSYPSRIWDIDIVEAIHNIWMEEIQQKLEEYKTENPNKKIINYQYSEREYCCEKRIFIEMTINFDVV